MPWSHCWIFLILIARSVAALGAPCSCASLLFNKCQRNRNNKRLFIWWNVVFFTHNTICLWQIDMAIFHLYEGKCHRIRISCIWFMFSHSLSRTGGWDSFLYFKITHKLLNLGQGSSFCHQPPNKEVYKFSFSTSLVYLKYNLIHASFLVISLCWFSLTTQSTFGFVG